MNIGPHAWVPSTLTIELSSLFLVSFKSSDLLRERVITADYFQNFPVFKSLSRCSTMFND